MKVAIQLVSVVMAGIVLLLAVEAYLSVRHETELYQTDMRHDAHLLGQAMKGPIADVWHARGAQRALELVGDANREEHVVRIRWVWLDAAPGDEFYPRVGLEKLGSAVRGREVSVDDRDEEGHRCLRTYVPVPVDPRRPGALELSESYSPLEAYRRVTIARKLGTMGVLLAGSGLAVVLLGTGLIARPLQRLIEKVRRVGQGDLSGPVFLGRKDEFGELASAVNTMCEQLADAREAARRETSARIAALEQLRHADRLATVGRLASGIAHELGTPLNVVWARAKLIRDGALGPAETRDSASIITSQSERMTTTIRQLLDFARRSPPEMTEVDLREVAHRTVELLAPLAHKQAVDLHVDAAEEPVMVRADSKRIDQAVTNLVVNAIQAMPRGGTVELGFARKPAPPPGKPVLASGPYLAVTVCDHGSGVAREDVPCLFEPFFTTKDVGEGTGLGLSIADDIIHEHGGWIEVTSEPGVGSCFSIYLPEHPGGNGKWPRPERRGVR